jgi:hypothetical protein
MSKFKTMLEVFTELTDIVGKTTTKLKVESAANKLKKDPNIKNSDVNKAVKKLKALRTDKKGEVGTNIPSQKKEAVAGSIDARSGAPEDIAFQQSYGKGGKETITQGKRSYVRMDDAASKGSRDRAKKVAELEKKARTDADAKEAVKKLDAKSKTQDIARTRKAAAKNSENARKSRGISLSDGVGTDKVKKVGRVEKETDKFVVGDQSNGITDQGVIYGNPTKNQEAIAIRNLEARTRLSAEARANLAKLKARSKEEKQTRAINKLNRNMVDTGKDRNVRTRKYSQGGMSTGFKPRTGHTDMRGKGLFK